MALLLVNYDPSSGRIYYFDRTSTATVDGVNVVAPGTAFTGAGRFLLIELTSGLYTPALINQTNISSSSLVEAMYSRNGNIVHVTLKVNITPTTAGSSTVLTFALPFNTASTSGTGVLISSANVTGIVDNASSSTAKITFTTPNTSSAVYYIQFDYSLV